jgi:hypothetical protein
VTDHGAEVTLDEPPYEAPGNWYCDRLKPGAADLVMNFGQQFLEEQYDSGPLPRSSLGSWTDSELLYTSMIEPGTGTQSNCAFEYLPGVDEVTVLTSPRQDAAAMPHSVDFLEPGRNNTNPDPETIIDPEVVNTSPRISGAAAVRPPGMDSMATADSLLRCSANK